MLFGYPFRGVNAAKLQGRKRLMQAITERSGVGSLTMTLELNEGCVVLVHDPPVSPPVISVHTG